MIIAEPSQDELRQEELDRTTDLAASPRLPADRQNLADRPVGRSQSMRTRVSFVHHHHLFIIVYEHKLFKLVVFCHFGNFSYICSRAAATLSGIVSEY